jgi:hypothetical protein
VKLAGGPLLTLKRDSDQTLTWSGDRFNSNAIATAVLTWPADTRNNRLTCTTSARSGKVTIPAKILTQVPVTAATLSLTVNSTSYLPADIVGSPFTIQNSSSDTRPVDIQ